MAAEDYAVELGPDWDDPEWLELDIDLVAEVIGDMLAEIEAEGYL